MRLNNYVDAVTVQTHERNQCLRLIIKLLSDNKSIQQI